MTTLKDLTLEKLSHSLPLDLLDDLVSHHLRNVFFVKIISLERIFEEISDNIIRRTYRGDFLKILYEFIDSFEEIADDVKCIEGLIRDEIFTESYDEWYGYVKDELLKDGYIFLHGDKGLVLICSRNNKYYRFNTKNIHGYKRHSEVMDFFITKDLKPTYGYTFIKGIEC